MQDNDQLMLKALEAIKANDQMRAAEILEVVLQNDPKNDKAWLMAAKLFDDPQKRLEYAQKAFTVNPNNGDARQMVQTLSIEINNAEYHPKRKSSVVSLLDFIVIGTVLFAGIAWLFNFLGPISMSPSQEELMNEDHQTFASELHPPVYPIWTRLCLISCCSKANAPL